MGCLTKELLPALPLDPQLALFERGSPEMSDGLREQLFEDFLVGAMTGRQFMMSNSDMLCLGTGAADPGDLICVLLGCSTPIILRKVKDYYLYIGDVYVDGYMYGKAIDELNNGTRQLQTFELR
jgi:hypothetical protein